MPKGIFKRTKKHKLNIGKAQIGEKNHNWKHGKKAFYNRVHEWIRREYEKASFCESENCKMKSKKFEWALKKGKRYAKKKDNFLMLCISCHSLYDGKGKRMTPLKRPQIL